MIIRINASMRRFSNCAFALSRTINKLFEKEDKNDFGIPIIINNYNRFGCLVKLLNQLEFGGYNNIFIIDNNSTYGPLIDFYTRTKYKVYRLNKNCGHFALWDTILYSKFSDGYYVYTDPDVIPSSDGIHDIISVFKSLLDRFPLVDKVGCALRIDDLPDHYIHKANVLKWEKQFWNQPVSSDIFLAPIDTTFALYRPGVKGGANVNALRVAGRHTAVHLPWYENSSKLSEETKFYSQTANTSSSWYQSAQTIAEKYE